MTKYFLSKRDYGESGEHQQQGPGNLCQIGSLLATAPLTSRGGLHDSAAAKCATNTVGSNLES